MESNMILDQEKVAQLGLGIESGLKGQVRISIPDKYTIIDASAFEQCVALLRVTFPSSLQALYYKAFKDCFYLEEIFFNDGIKRIGAKTFENCLSLKKIRFPNGLQTIETDAFQNCRSLEEIHLPSSIVSLERRAFANCPKLKQVYFEGRNYPAGVLGAFDNDVHFHFQNVPEPHIEPNISAPNEIRYSERPIKGKGGFADIAGLEDLKEQLQSDVIDVILEPERAKALGICLPNGILLYGPPGCGKTFFAQKFAEEAGFNFQLVNCSDIASTYVHGTQEKIAEVFKQAREKAPTILFFDEIESMITKREKHTNVGMQGEVNEFLTQLNACGKDKIIVIGATNRPQDIDEAALRAGRLEMKVYIPQPDKETRRTLFLLKLKDRALANDINIDKLVERTEGYVSADVAMFIEQTARLAFRKRRQCISMDLFDEVLKSFEPTVSKDTIQEYERIRDKFKNKQSQKRTPIGFC